MKNARTIIWLLAAAVLAGCFDGNGGSGGSPQNNQADSTDPPTTEPEPDTDPTPMPAKTLDRVDDFYGEASRVDLTWIPPANSTTNEDRYVTASNWMPASMAPDKAIEGDSVINAPAEAALVNPNASSRSRGTIRITRQPRAGWGGARKIYGGRQDDFGDKIFPESVVFQDGQQFVVGRNETQEIISLYWQYSQALIPYDRKVLELDETCCGLHPAHAVDYSDDAPGETTVGFAYPNTNLSDDDKEGLGNDGFYREFVIQKFDWIGTGHGNSDAIERFTHNPSIISFGQAYAELRQYTKNQGYLPDFYTDRDSIDNPGVVAVDSQFGDFLDVNPWILTVDPTNTISHDSQSAEYRTPDTSEVLFKTATVPAAVARNHRTLIDPQNPDFMGVVDATGMAWFTDDNGATWTQGADMPIEMEDSIFIRNGVIRAAEVVKAGEYTGEIVIRKSEDTGETWTEVARREFELGPVTLDQVGVLFTPQPLADGEPVINQGEVDTGGN